MSISVLRRDLRSAWTLVACALFGLTASFVLTVEKIHLLQNPGATPSCSINPFISCSSAISSAQSEFFGVPLTLFGIVAYAALLTLGALLLVRSTFSKIVWQAALAVAALGFIGVHYLIAQSVFFLHMICPWCFGVWLTTPIVLVVLLGAAPPQNLPGWLAPLVAHRYMALAAWYCALIALLLISFRDAWTML